MSRIDDYKGVLMNNDFVVFGRDLFKCIALGDGLAVLAEQYLEVKFDNKDKPYEELCNNLNNVKFLPNIDGFELPFEEFKKMDFDPDCDCDAIEWLKLNQMKSKDEFISELEDILP